ncbi:MAG TPA: SRPBCC family protein [Polyangia bacterium]|jgi:ribosome-associated toxin RatA of RatAB toxin-antitoxin module
MDGREPVTRSVHLAGLPPARLFAVVTDFPAYPRLFPEIKEARVLSRTPAGAGGEIVRVEFKAQVVLAVRYVLDLVCRLESAEPAATSTVDWTYVEGEIVTESEGGWRFVPQGDGTVMSYRASLSVRAPLPGFVLRKVTDGLVAASLPAMFKAIEREARGRQAAG